MGQNNSAASKPIMNSASAESTTDPSGRPSNIEIKLDEKGATLMDEQPNGDSGDGDVGLLAKHQQQKKESEVEVRSPNQELRYWVSQGNIDKVKELANKDADVNAPDLGPEIKEDPKKKKKKKDDDKPKESARISGDYPLHIAAEKGDVKMIEALFYLQARMECKNRIGSTPLHRAVSSGMRDAVMCLIKLGADPRAVNLLGNTPLHIATIMGDLEMMKLLTTLLDKKDGRIQNKVFLTPIEYTVVNSPERQVLLEWDSTLADLVSDNAALGDYADNDEKE